MICFLFVGQIVNAQINIGGEPKNFNKNLHIKNSRKNKDSQVKIEINNIGQLLKEDKKNDSIGKIYRFGIPIKVSYNLNNSGEWLELENGDRIWSLSINCLHAKSISVNFDNFKVPTGCSLYIYNGDKSDFIGGFVSKTDIPSNKDSIRFATKYLKSENIIIEYFEPKEKINTGTISISDIIFGYKDLTDILSGAPGVTAPGSCGCTGYSGCDVDINCTVNNGEGNLWQIEKTSVAKLVQWHKIQDGILVSNGAAFCSGSLINNTRNDGKLYFLTANHCIDSTYDALRGLKKGKVMDWLIYWNYENTNCENDNQIAEAYVTYGATVLANSHYRTWEAILPDFALLELNQSPYDVGFKAEYNGWSIIEPTNSQTYVGIHHPNGKPKKISTGNLNILQNSSRGIDIDFVRTQPSGIASRLYSNSSGSPLYNGNHRVIGQANTVSNQFHFTFSDNAQSPNSIYYDCTQTQNATYGKFNSSWTWGTENERQLKHWLDPDNTGATTIDGMTCTVKNLNNNYTSTNKIETYCQIQSSNVIISNSNITFDAANGVYIPANFEVKLGSSFEIK